MFLTYIQGGQEKNVDIYRLILLKHKPNLVCVSMEPARERKHTERNEKL